MIFKVVQEHHTHTHKEEKANTLKKLPLHVHTKRDRYEIINVSHRVPLMMSLHLLLLTDDSSLFPEIQAHLPIDPE